jgi:hypothetical protein
MKETYLQLHERLLRTGLCDKNATHGGGLCNVIFRGKPLEDSYCFTNLKPNMGLTAYWGYDGSPEHGVIGGAHPRRYKYTPLRQNLVLLMAAINDEL